MRIDGKEFKVKDAAVQMIYPHPLNAARYVWMFAGTSTNGMYFAEPSPLRGDDWDYIIMDGHIPAFKQAAYAPRDARRVGHLRLQLALRECVAGYAGDAEARAKGRNAARPDKNLKIDPKMLDSYVGRYQIVGWPGHRDVHERRQAHGRLGRTSDELLPENETSST